MKLARSNMAHYFREPNSFRTVNCKRLPGEGARKKCREWNNLVRKRNKLRAEGKIKEAEELERPYLEAWTWEGVFFGKKSQKLLSIPLTNNEILTDAGWEVLSFEEACEFFDPTEIREWYSNYWEYADIEDIFAELGINNIDLEDEEAVERFLQTYDWTPKQVKLIVAKAVYKNDAWVRVIKIAECEDEDCFDRYERDAILLGIHLRNQLGLDIPVINDNLNAVRDLFGYRKIGWQSRRCVAKAHRLKIAQATKKYNEQLWEQEWEEEYYSQDC